MGTTPKSKRYRAVEHDTGGLELANTQSFIKGLCRLIGVAPPNDAEPTTSQATGGIVA